MPKISTQSPRPQFEPIVTSYSAMGTKRMGPPPELVESLRSTYAIRYFVETGTFQGQTAVWASKSFELVYSIEACREFYEKARTRYEASHNNISFRLGDSRQQLKILGQELTGPSLVWLDAHWCGLGSHGHQDQCPLLDEVQQVNSWPHQNYVFIDDARLFLSPPGVPFDEAQWPSLSEIIRALGDRYVIVVEDCIVAVPVAAKSLLVNYCRNLSNEVSSARGSHLASLKSRLRKLL